MSNKKREIDERAGVKRKTQLTSTLNPVRGQLCALAGEVQHKTTNAANNSAPRLIVARCLQEKRGETIFRE